VSIPDFVIRTSLRADELTSRTAPEPETRLEAVELERREASDGLPPNLEPGERYEDIAIERHLLGEVRAPN
jgi:hypothetical protein